MTSRRGFSIPKTIVPSDAPTYNAWINYRNIFYWDRNSMATAERATTPRPISAISCTTSYNYDINTVSGVLESEKVAPGKPHLVFLPQPASGQ